jgi:hypothetical protein
VPQRGWVIGVLVAAALAGCGDDEKSRGLTSGQSQALVAQLEAARTTAAAGDIEGTESALTSFRRSIARLERSGALSAEAARALRVGAARVLKQVQRDFTPPPTTYTDTFTVPTPAPAQTPGKGKGKGHGKGKGKKKHGKGKKDD